jgi:hypothetical protein
VRTLQGASGAYNTLAAAEGKSPRTIEWVVSAAQLFARFLGPDVAMNQINRQDLRRFVQALQQRPRSASQPTA